MIAFAISICVFAQNAGAQDVKIATIESLKTDGVTIKAVFYGSDGDIFAVESGTTNKTDLIAGVDIVVDGTAIDLYSKDGTAKLIGLTIDNQMLTKLELIDCTDLNYLRCYGNQISSLDLTDCINLIELGCSENNLSILDITYNTELGILNCQNNNITTLNVTKNIWLSQIQCHDNYLTSLDVTKNTALGVLRCQNNYISTLDVTKNTALYELFCDHNNLSTLDVTKNTALTTLNCYSNNISTLDVTKNTALTLLYCYSNNLSTLDVTKNTALITLSCSSNNLSTLDLSKNTALTTLNCLNNNLTSLDLTKNTALTWLQCQNNNLTSLDITGCNSLQTLNAGNQTITLPAAFVNNGVLSIQNILRYNGSVVRTITGANASGDNIRWTNLTGDTGTATASFTTALPASVTTIFKIPFEGVFSLSWTPNIVDVLLQSAVICPGETSHTLYFPTSYNTNMFSYQWYCNDVAIPEANASSFTINNITPGYEKYFYAIATDAFGDYTTSVASVRALAPMPDVMTFAITPASANVFTRTDYNFAVNEYLDISNVLWSSASQSVIIAAGGHSSSAATGKAATMRFTRTGPDIIYATFVHGCTIGNNNRTIAFAVNVAEGDVSNEHASDALLKAFPNPTDGHVKVTGLTAGAEINIYSINGKLVMSAVAASEESRIDLSPMPAGLYFLRSGDLTLRIVRK